MSLPSQDLEQLYDAVVVDRDGDRVGTVGQIYLDDATEQPTFVTIRTGLFGTRETFVPVQDADYTDDGELRVPYDKSMIKGCPTVDPEGHVDPDEQTTLFAHYGVKHDRAGTGDADDAGDATSEDGRTEEGGASTPD